MKNWVIGNAFELELYWVINGKIFCMPMDVYLGFFVFFFPKVMSVI
uniref:Uncharacterized protein n=1 Tax=Rhizophora mucronata TaxID=61149 RepID=A0A2P2NLN0_RHIMU